MGNADAAAGASALLTIERAEAVLTIGLNRPAKRNALNDGIIRCMGSRGTEVSTGRERN